MRRKRLKMEDGCYHVVSRISGKRFLLDDGEKDVLLGMIKAAAEFSGVEIYTYAIMTNHFHLLVRVPAKREVSDAELERRVRALYGDVRAAKVFDKWEKWEKRGVPHLADDERLRLRARMFDISQFCKTFKETYTQDYNRRTGNTGTIWEGRFKSNLIEPSGRALAAVAAYIHLNPVRAEIVNTPEEFKWSGFGAGCHFDRAARKGLCSMASALHNEKIFQWSQVRTAFESLHNGKLHGRKPLSANSVESLVNKRVAAFSNGTAIGGAGFLKSVQALLPQRVNCRPEVVFDKYPGIGFSTATGVREREGA